MSVMVLTPASTYRLTTMDAVKEEIPLQDQVLFADSLITQASVAIARKLGTILAQQRYRETQDGAYPGRALHLRYWPLVDVDPVSVGAMPITDYWIESAEGAVVGRYAGWTLPASWDVPWTLDYIAGFILPEQVNPPDPLGPTLPGDLERACIECVKVWFHERMVGSRVEARTLGDQRIDYGVQARHTAIPVLAEDLIQPWMRLRVA